MYYKDITDGWVYDTRTASIAPGCFSMLGVIQDIVLLEDRYLFVFNNYTTLSLTVHPFKDYGLEYMKHVMIGKQIRMVQRYYYMTGIALVIELHHPDDKGFIFDSFKFQDIDYAVFEKVPHFCNVKRAR